MNNKLNCDNVDTRSFISDGSYKRILPSASLENSYLTRPVETRHVIMPMTDCRKPSNVKTLLHPSYKTDKIFNPGHRGPYIGYSNKVDKESQLKNMFHPLQKCSQREYVPDSKSELYKEAIQEMKRLNLPYIEYTQTQFPPSLFTDEIHLNEEGRAKLTSLFLQDVQNVSVISKEDF